jgi:hypothetical protein
MTGLSDEERAELANLRDRAELDRLRAAERRQTLSDELRGKIIEARFHQEWRMARGWDETAVGPSAEAPEVYTFALAERGRGRPTRWTFDLYRRHWFRALRHGNLGPDAAIAKVAEHFAPLDATSVDEPEPTPAINRKTLERLVARYGRPGRPGTPDQERHRTD